MKFKEYIEIQGKLIKGISSAPGSPGFIDLVRSWNSLAVLFPEKCEDVILWPLGEDPYAHKNDKTLDMILGKDEVKKIVKQSSTSESIKTPKLAIKTPKMSANGLVS